MRSNFKCLIYNVLSYLHFGWRRVTVCIRLNTLLYIIEGKLFFFALFIGRKATPKATHAWFILNLLGALIRLRKQQRLVNSRDNEPCITDKKMAGQACLIPVIFLFVYIGRMPETGCMRSMRRFTAHCWVGAKRKRSRIASEVYLVRMPETDSKRSAEEVARRKNPYLFYYF